MMPDSGSSCFDIWNGRIIATDAVDAYCTKGQRTKGARFGTLGVIAPVDFMKFIVLSTAATPSAAQSLYREINNAPQIWS